jgi:ERCC4-type nuclease
MPGEQDTSDSVVMKIEKPKIIFDSRESKSLVISGLRDKAELEEKVLEIGDFILSERAVCERKTTQDFVKSIMDGRLFEQIVNMKNEFACPLLVIEGNDLYASNVKPQAIRGAIAAIAVDFSIPTIWTKSPFDTAEMLLSIASREQMKEGRDVRIRSGKKPKSTRHMQKYLVSSLPGVDSYRADNLLKHFKCPEFLFTASEKELRDVKGIGKETAKRIREIIGEDYE